MINLNLNQDNKLTFNVGIVGTKTPPNIVRLCLGNDLVKLSFDASPTKSEMPNNSEWTVTIPALPELSKYFVGPVRIKIEVIVAGRYFIPFDKELSIEASGNSSFEVTNMTVTSTQVAPIATVIPVGAEEEEEEVKEPEEKKEPVATSIMRIIEPKVEEKKKQPVLSKEMLLGEHISTIRNETKPKSTKKYYLKPLKAKHQKDTEVSISNVVKNVIKEESKKDATVVIKTKQKEAVRNTPKKNEIPFELIKKNIVEK